MEIKTILITDCGSTTTKALLFEKKEDRWHQTYRGEAPTTVEAPIADITVGVLNACYEIEELSKRKIIDLSQKDHPFISRDPDNKNGIDIYLSTSSAGGGLQMIVAGVVKEITAESAARAALGAGAIVLDVISIDDKREEFEIISRIKELKPDIFLLVGGVDGGDSQRVLELAELVVVAEPLPRFGDTLKLPIVYAGNKEVAEDVKKILQKNATVEIVDNVRPDFDKENLQPAKEAIHDLFLSHVMSHSPGYDRLMSWTGKPIMPTPSAVGDMVQLCAKENNLQVLCVDIGGATTDIFSVFNNIEGKPIYNRTVSANYGMSYSIANVLIEAGVNNIARWLPYEINADELKDRLRNKMIRPTSIPQTKEDLLIEQAISREALRLSFEHHKSLAVGLSGIQRKRGIADFFSQSQNRYELIDLMKLDLIIGSGGVLSHAPSRLDAAIMLLDGFGLKGVTQIVVDSIFMLPHLGVLSTVSKEAANDVLFKDCLVNVGYAVVPIGSKENDKILADVKLIKNNWQIKKGELNIINVAEGERVELQVIPKHRSINCGAGNGRKVTKEIITGKYIILDGRK